MYYFIHGADTYRSRKKLREFAKNLAGDREVLIYDASIDDVTSHIDEHMRNNPLFGGGIVSVILHALSGKKENSEWFGERLESIASSEAPFIFWEGVAGSAPAPSKKSTSAQSRQKKGTEPFERFISNAEKTFEFPYLTNSALKKEIAAMAEEMKCRIDENAVERLADRCGGDLWMAAHEIEKYALAGSFEFQSAARVQEKLYDFFDALIEGDSARAYTLAEGVRAGGFGEEYVVAALAGTLRNMIKVKALLPTNPDYKKYEEFGMHPFVLKKTLSHVRRFRLEDLRRLYQVLAENDHALKAGDEDPETFFAKVIESFH